MQTGLKSNLYYMFYCMCQMLYTILNFVHRGKRVMSTTETKLVYNLKLNVEQRRCYLPETVTGIEDAPRAIECLVSVDCRQVALPVNVKRHSGV